MKLNKEWKINAPWGKMALASWGDPYGEPVLLVHGRQDSLMTFQPLLDLMPNTYNYVGFDLPGHGHSDPFPSGVMLLRFHFVTAIEVVVKHLGWQKYMFMAHSMGSEAGLFYNALHPNEITRMIVLDPIPPLHYIQNRVFPDFYKTFYESYHNNYSKDKNERFYSKQAALEAVMRARMMDEGQAERILARNLTRVGEDVYKLSWEKRLKYLAPLNLENDYHLKVFSKNLPPTLFICATNKKRKFNPERKKSAQQLVDDLERTTSRIVVKVVDGEHDVHFTNPDRIIEHVLAFINKRNSLEKSKL